ncbi:hypothetical protein O3P69_002928 [Scylla paramamosain]|uniref:Uncharacterized protein n=1 Tax=Scylla paramamosain TaxID=85552 RepID=A0AAW0UJ69_SCYPA
MRVADASTKHVNLICLLGVHKPLKRSQGAVLLLRYRLEREQRRGGTGSGHGRAAARGREVWAVGDTTAHLAAVAVSKVTLTSLASLSLDDLCDVEHVYAGHCRCERHSSSLVDDAPSSIQQHYLEEALVVVVVVLMQRCHKHLDCRQGLRKGRRDAGVVQASWRAAAPLPDTRWRRLGVCNPIRRDDLNHPHPAAPGERRGGEQECMGDPEACIWGLVYMEWVCVGAGGAGWAGPAWVVSRVPLTWRIWRASGDTRLRPVGVRQGERGTGLGKEEQGGGKEEEEEEESGVSCRPGAPGGSGTIPALFLAGVPLAIVHSGTEAAATFTDQGRDPHRRRPDLHANKCQSEKCPRVAAPQANTVAQAYSQRHDLQHTPCNPHRHHPTTTTTTTTSSLQQSHHNHIPPPPGHHHLNTTSHQFGG